MLNSEIRYPNFEEWARLTYINAKLKNRKEVSADVHLVRDISTALESAFSQGILLGKTGGFK